MSSDRPVVLTVERKAVAADDEAAMGFYPEAELMITNMRQMSRLEYAWYRLKQTLNFKHTHQTAVNDATLERVGILGHVNIGIELSMNCWHRLVSGSDCATLQAWGWLNKYSSIMLTPVPPVSMSTCETYNEDASV